MGDLESLGISNPSLSNSSHTSGFQLLFPFLPSTLCSFSLPPFSHQRLILPESLFSGRSQATMEYVNPGYRAYGVGTSCPININGSCSLLEDDNSIALPEGITRFKLLPFVFFSHFRVRKETRYRWITIQRSSKQLGVFLPSA